MGRVLQDTEGRPDSFTAIGMCLGRGPEDPTGSWETVCYHCSPSMTHCAESSKCFLPRGHWDGGGLGARGRVLDCFSGDQGPDHPCRGLPGKLGTPGQ